MALMRTITERLLEAQKDLTTQEIHAFREHYREELGNGLTTVSFLMKLYGQNCVHVTRMILWDINREDLAKKFDSKVVDQGKLIKDKIM